MGFFKYGAIVGSTREFTNGKGRGYFFVDSSRLTDDVVLTVATAQAWLVLHEVKEKARPLLQTHCPCLLVLADQFESNCGARSLPSSTFDKVLLPFLHLFQILRLTFFDKPTTERSIMVLHLKSPTTIKPGYQSQAIESWAREGLIPSAVKFCDGLMLTLGKESQFTTHKENVNCKRCINKLAVLK